MVKPALSALVVLCGLLALEAAAGAATNTARNRCSDAVRILRGNPSMAFRDRDVDPLAVKNAVAHHRQVVEGWNMASAKINQIPPAELDVNDPDLAECVAEVRKWRAYITDLEAKIQRAEGQGAKLGPFLDAVRPYERSLYALLAVAFDAGADPLTNAKKEDARRILDELGSVEKACAAQVPDAGAALPGQHGGPGGQVQRSGGVAISAELARNADAWCFVARSRVELMTRALGNKHFHAEGYGNYGILLPEAIEAVTRGGGNMEAWIADMVVFPEAFKEKLRAEAAAWYAATGIAMPAEPFAALDAKLDELRAAIDAAAPRAAPFPSGPHDSTIEKGAARTLLEIYPRAKVVKAVMDSPDYTISKNGVGIPTDRYRSGQILFKLPGARWCAQRTFSYVEPYSGGGRFARASKVNVLGATRFLSCD